MTWEQIARERTAERDAALNVLAVNEQKLQDALARLDKLDESYLQELEARVRGLEAELTTLRAELTGQTDRADGLEELARIQREAKETASAERDAAIARAEELEGNRDYWEDRAGKAEARVRELEAYNTAGREAHQRLYDQATARIAELEEEVSDLKSTVRHEGGNPDWYPTRIATLDAALREAIARLEDHGCAYEATELYRALEEK